MFDEIERAGFDRS